MMFLVAQEGAKKLVEKEGKRIILQYIQVNYSMYIISLIENLEVPPPHVPHKGNREYVMPSTITITIHKILFWYKV